MLKMTLHFDSSMGGLGFMNLGFFLTGLKFKYKKPPLGTGFSISNKLNFFEKIQNVVSLNCLRLLAFSENGKF